MYVPTPDGQFEICYHRGTLVNENLDGIRYMFCPDCGAVAMFYPPCVRINNLSPNFRRINEKRKEADKVT